MNIRFKNTSKNESFRFTFKYISVFKNVVSKMDIEIFFLTLQNIILKLKSARLVLIHKITVIRSLYVLPNCAYSGQGAGYWARGAGFESQRDMDIFSVSDSNFNVAPSLLCPRVKNMTAAPVISQPINLCFFFSNSFINS